MVGIWLALDVMANSGSEPTSEVIETEIVSSEAMLFEAKRWNLTVKEYQRYTEVISGPLGRWNPDIDPLMALGLYANNDIDRQRYAELYAQQEYELIKRTLAFQRSYRSAFGQLFPDANIIDSEYLQGYYDDQGHKKQRQSKLPILNSHNQTNTIKLKCTMDLSSGDRA